MKSGAETGQPLSLCLEDVSHLVHEQQHHEPDPEPPTADPDVDGRRDQHREQELELEQDDAELGQESPDAAIGAQSFRKNPRQSKPFGWIGSYWRHSWGYCSMSAIVPIGIGSNAPIQEPRPIHSSPPS